MTRTSDAALSWWLARPAWERDELTSVWWGDKRGVTQAAYEAYISLELYCAISGGLERCLGSAR